MKTGAPPSWGTAKTIFWGGASWETGRSAPPSCWLACWRWRPARRARRRRPPTCRPPRPQQRQRSRLARPTRRSVWSPCAPALRLRRPPCPLPPRRRRSRPPGGASSRRWLTWASSPRQSPRSPTRRRPATPPCRRSSPASRPTPSVWTRWIWPWGRRTCRWSGGWTTARRALTWCSSRSSPTAGRSMLSGPATSWKCRPKAAGA